MTNLANAVANYLRLDFTNENSLGYESFFENGATTIERPASEESMCICVKSTAAFKLKFYFNNKIVGKMRLTAGEHALPLDEYVLAGEGLLVITVDPLTSEAQPQSCAYKLVANFGFAYQEFMNRLWANRRSAAIA